MVRTRSGLERVVAQDRRLFARHRRARATLAAARARAESLVAELASARREVARREDRIRQRLAERRNRVALLRTRSTLERRAAKELRAAAARLSEALDSLPRGSPPGVGSGLVRGKVPPPVSGAVRLGFGRQHDPEFNTETLHNGVEIAADPGAPVAAVADGRVLFAGWFRGYGRIVILDHGRGDVTVSAHLDQLRVKAGDAVVQGDEIGTVGETGPLSGPGLYFEIRVDGKPVDPEQWLAHDPGGPSGTAGAGVLGLGAPGSVQGEP
ncbi:MAG: murein hydrolase activator EnvC family protein [Myxococcota bacterium]